MNERILVSLALFALAAPAFAGCGGGDSDEDKIAAAIEKATTTSDPGNCTALETQRFNEQNTQRKGEAATKACEEEAAAGEERAEAAKVSNVSVDGEAATAEVKFEGGSLGSQKLEVALLQEEGDWKLDRVEGFAAYDGQALGEAFQKRLEKEPEGLSPEQAECIARKIAAATKAEAEALFFSGTPDAIEELAEGCA